MSVRELVALGTAGQAPTRHRNHDGYLLRRAGGGVLTHFSQHHANPEAFAREVAVFDGGLVVAADLARVPVPPRPGAPR